MVQLSHPYVTTGKTIALTIWIFVSKMMSLILNMLSRFVMAFLQRSKCLLISWRQWPSTVILELKKIVCHYFHCFPVHLPWSDRTGCHDLSFLNVSFKPAFSLSSFTFIKRLLSSSSLSAFSWYHLHIWGCWCFSQQSWFQLTLHTAWHFSWCTLPIS